MSPEWGVHAFEAFNFISYEHPSILDGIVDAYNAKKLLEGPLASKIAGGMLIYDRFAMLNDNVIK